MVRAQEACHIGSRVIDYVISLCCNLHAIASHHAPIWHPFIMAQIHDSLDHDTDSNLCSQEVVLFLLTPGSKVRLHNGGSNAPINLSLGLTGSTGAFLEVAGKVRTVGW